MVDNDWQLIISEVWAISEWAQAVFFWNVVGT